MRYIDADELIKKIFPYDVVNKKDYSINAKAVADAIANIPTADKEMSERMIEERKIERKLVAREIFEEIAQISCRISENDGNGNIRILCYQLSSEKLAELKKKYTEGK